ncbi:MAG: hypothetical protein RLZ12_979 [Bacillota bacterium]|jgi:hypothetical protein
MYYSDINSYPDLFNISAFPGKGKKRKREVESLPANKLIDEVWRGYTQQPGRVWHWLSNRKIHGQPDMIGPDAIKALKQIPANGWTESKSTRSYGIPRGPIPPLPLDFKSSPCKLNAALQDKVSVVPKSSEVVLDSYCCQSRVGLLNFASGVQPGGEFLHDNDTQEEALMRHAPLAFISLYGFAHSAKGWYYGKETGYLDPKGELLVTTNIPIASIPCTFTLLSMAALGFIAPRGRLTPRKEKYMKGYIDLRVLESSPLANNYHAAQIWHMINTASTLKIQTLILGAYGCGAYNNDPETMACIFAYVLNNNPNAKTFNQIIFAVPGGKNLEVFSRVFPSSGAPLPPRCVPGQFPSPSGPSPAPPAPFYPPFGGPPPPFGSPFSTSGPSPAPFSPYEQPPSPPGPSPAPPAPFYPSSGLSNPLHPPFGSPPFGSSPFSPSGPSPTPFDDLSPEERAQQEAMFALYELEQQRKRSKPSSSTPITSSSPPSSTPLHPPFGPPPFESPFSPSGPSPAPPAPFYPPSGLFDPLHPPFEPPLFGSSPSPYGLFPLSIFPPEPPLSGPYDPLHPPSSTPISSSSPPSSDSFYQPFGDLSPSEINQQEALLHEFDQQKKGSQP